MNTIRLIYLPLFLSLLSCLAGGQELDNTSTAQVWKSKATGFLNSLRDRVSRTRDSFVERWVGKGILALNSDADPDQFRDIPQLVRSRGFKVERHYILTEDGYILGVHRIINPYFKNHKTRPIILQHGIISSGRDFIVNSPGGDAEEIFTNTTIGNNLGFELAKRGFDVWLTNSRGNTYSLNHKRFSSLQPKFWDYSFDELIKYDLPATIDYILNVTDSGKSSTQTWGHDSWLLLTANLAYVGHSQGTQIMFGLLSTQVKYNEIIKPFIALSPVARVAHIKSPLRYLPRIPGLTYLFSLMKGPLLTSDLLWKTFTSMVCNHKRYSSICSSGMFLATGFNEAQLNISRLGVYAYHTPAGTSVKNILHMAQLINSGKFCKYDNGPYKNEELYGSDTPPEYPLHKITSRNIALFSSKNDWMSTAEDVEWLRTELKGMAWSDFIRT